MASRGGRGRGGFGRGRGGRGGAPMRPVARDDDGSILAIQQDGPPPLFPEVELPLPPEELNSKELLLLSRRHDLVAHSKSSPFFIDMPKEKVTGTDANIERYSDKYLRKPQRVRPQLSSVITLIPEYFPEELYTTQDKKAKLSKQAQDAFWQAQANRADLAGGLQRLEQLAQLESKAGGGDKAAAGGAAAATAEDQPEEEILVDEDDEDDMENDDYYQGQHYDDDEGYDDGYDDGGDDGPIF